MRRRPAGAVVVRGGRRQGGRDAVRGEARAGTALAVREARGEPVRRRDGDE